MNFIKSEPLNAHAPCQHFTPLVLLCELVFSIKDIELFLWYLFMLMKKYALGKLNFKTFLPPKKETLYSLSSYSSTLPPGNHQSAFCFYGWFSYSGCKYTSFYCALLYWIFFAPELKLCGNPASSKSFWCCFSNSICSLCVFVSHFSNSHSISYFSIIMFVMVISCDCFRWHNLYLRKSAN